MPTSRKDEVKSVNPHALYKIEYPNSRRGMFSLRAPFKNTYFINENQREIYTRKTNPTIVRPEYLHVQQSRERSV